MRIVFNPLTGKFETVWGGDLATLGAIPNSGWIEVSDTWTRTGNYTFTVSGDLSAAFRKGTKVRYKQGGDFEYGVVISSSYSAPDTTITLAANNDYAMAAATITDTAISFIENPEGFPHWFNYAPTYSANGSMTYTSVSTTHAKFCVKGNTVEVNVFGTGTTGGTANTALYATPPITIATSAALSCAARDATTGGAPVGTGSANASLGVLAVRKADLSNYGLGTGRIMLISGVYQF